MRNVPHDVAAAAGRGPADVDEVDRLARFAAGPHFVSRDPSDLAPVHSPSLAHTAAVRFRPWPSATAPLLG